MHDSQTSTPPVARPQVGSYLLRIRQAILEGGDGVAEAEDLLRCLPQLIADQGRTSEDKPALDPLALDLRLIRALEEADARLACAQPDPMSHPHFGWGGGVAMLLSTFDEGIRRALSVCDDTRKHATVTWNLVHCLLMVLKKRLGMSDLELQTDLAMAQQVLIDQQEREQALRDTSRTMADLSIVPGGKKS